MELKIWAKTMLTVKKYLERVIEAIDSMIYKKAMGSIYVTTKNLTTQSALAVSESILELSERKVNLINLNTLCVQALKEIDKICAKVLILKHIDGRQSTEIAKLLGISDRTYFRKLNKAYDLMGGWLQDNGFTNEYFFNKFEGEGWIMETFYINKEFFKNNNSIEKIITFDGDILRSLIKRLAKPVAHSSYS